MISETKLDEMNLQTKTTKLNNKDKLNKTESSSLFDLRTTYGQILFLFITVTVSSLIQLIPTQVFTNSLRLFELQHCDKLVINENKTNEIDLRRPRYYIYGKSVSEDHLKHVHLVLQRLGIKPTTTANDTDWDLLWAHDYPFHVNNLKLKNLKLHQKVNHFPGCGFITNKVNLATTDNKYIPKAFQLPSDKDAFLEYTKQYPNKLFVQKNNQHREIYVRGVTEIDFSSNNSFLQEYIDNPLLVDGYKFDLGVYVIITSVDPLRIYIYKGDVLFRYCPAKYYPFDASNLDKYVVGDDYLPTWDVPSLSQFYNELGFGMKASFDAYINSKGKDTDYIWNQVEDAIRMVVLQKEQSIINILKSYKSKHNFFEMMRFDLLIDEHLKVYLLEANMSPNLSSAHFTQNTYLYEQVIYNLLNLVGVGSSLERESLQKRSRTVESMISSDKHIVVYAEKCATLQCSESCAQIECQLCRPCLDIEDITDLHIAYREHIQRGDTKRIFPLPIINKKLDEKMLNSLSPKNKMITKWFYGKCLMESSWCS